MDDAEIIAEFLVESRESLDRIDRDLVELALHPDAGERLSSVFRALHTIKGTSGFLALHRLEHLTHAGEALLSRLRDGEAVLTPAIAGALAATVDTVRALLDAVERTGRDLDPSVQVGAVVDLIGDLLSVGCDATGGATPARLVRAVSPAGGATGEPDVSPAATPAAPSASLGGGVQGSVTMTRLQPVGQVWAKLPRLVRDLSHQLGREVELVMDGQETELDRSLLAAVKDPLTHLVRNSLDHGIECPAERTAAGKPATGTLSLRAYHESGRVVVELGDDGRGIDSARIAAVAVERGVVTAEEVRRMASRDLLELIFLPGISTAPTVSHISGRGVGMDVVRTNVERVGGTVDVTSDVGRGTTTRLRMPVAPA